ncbi:MAG: hypothetical protein MI866_13760 [Bacteroidales bacterium]|nr:hypothetical protein [Bacteroidales bacterium]
MSSHIRIEPPYKLKTYIFLKDYMTIFGLVILLFGQIFSFSEYSHIDIQSIKLSYSETAKAKGKIINDNAIHYTFSDKYLFAYDYEMHHPELLSMYGTSFSEKALNAGDDIMVEYLEDKPNIHRIEGMSNSFLTDTTYIYVTIMLIGFYFIFSGAKRTLIFLKNIKNGYVTTAKLYERPTTRYIDDTRFIVMKFSFETKNGDTIKVKKELSNAQNLLDDAEELIVYDEKDPSKNYFVDRLPQKLKGYIYAELKSASL